MSQEAIGTGCCKVNQIVAQELDETILKDEISLLYEEVFVKLWDNLRAQNTTGPY